MKRLLIATFISGLLAGCDEGMESDKTIKLPPQDSAVVIDHQQPSDSTGIKDSAREIIY